MTLTRLIALEREQIGLLKAIGYGQWPIALHYLKLVLAIAVVGIAIGFALGTWFGTSLTRLYGRFFQFPIPRLRARCRRLPDGGWRFGRRRNRRRLARNPRSARAAAGRCHAAAGTGAFPPSLGRAAAGSTPACRR